MYVCIYLFIYFKQKVFFKCLLFEKIFSRTCTPPQVPMSFAALRYLGVGVPLPVNYKKNNAHNCICMYVCIYFKQKVFFKCLLFENFFFL